MLSADESQVLGSIEFLINVTLPLPPPHVPVDPSIVWEESTDLSISINGGNAWNAGRITDILLRSDAIFVAASTGGVWGINVHDPDAPAGCTTDDLDNPNFSCLAFGPDSPLQIYGGCSSLRLSARPGTGLFLRGLSEWRPVPIVDGFNRPLQTDGIYRVLVLPNHRVILLATVKGVFISFIPPPGQQHTFALVPSLPAAQYSGLCVGPNETVVASLWGPNGGIFLGTWSGSQLTFAPAQMIPDPSQPNGSINLTQVTRTSVASCGSDPSIMYAVFAGLNNSIYRILRSDSGGASWRPLRTLGDRVASNRLAPLAPDTFDPDFKDYMAGVTGLYTNCIAVDFHDPNLVGIGWANGAFALFGNTTGNNNNAFGFEALFSNTTGPFNNAFGNGALASNTTGDRNTAIGEGVMISSTTGSMNTAVGVSALRNNTTGSNNIAIGQDACNANASANFNTGVGVDVLVSNTADGNTAIGAVALLSNTTGGSNTAIGDDALVFNTTGNNNTALGAGAGNNVITAGNVISIGAGVAGADVSNTTWIGNIYGVTTQSGTTAQVIVSDTGQLGTVTSSERFKKDIATMDKASEIVLSLRPVTFHYKSDAKGTPQFGLIAEEVAKVNPALVLPDKEGKPYTVRYDQVNAMLLNEFLKEHQKVQDLEKQVEKLTAGLQKVSAQLESSKPAPQVVNNP